MSVIISTSRTVIILDGNFKIALAAGSASVAEFNKHKNSSESRYEHKWEESDPVSSRLTHAIIHSFLSVLRCGTQGFICYVRYSYVIRPPRCQLIYLFSRWPALACFISVDIYLIRPFSV